jgi:PAS domain S-box-containing protein
MLTHQQLGRPLTMSGTGVPKNIQPPDLFQAIVENTGSPQFLLRDGRVLYTNPAFERLTGYSVAELVDLGIFQIFSENAEAVGHLNALQGGSNPHSSFETGINAKDGKKLWVAVTLAPLGGLPASAVLGTISDLTAHKQREEALRQSELRYKTVFDMAPDMFVIYDPEGAILDQNEATFQLFGIPKEEALYKDGMMSTLCEEDKARFPQIREHTLKHGEWRGEFRAVRDLGRGPEFIDFDSRVKVADLGGEKIVICNARDVTERKQMEEQIRQALKEKETLLREIHHRVKNNMQIISALLKLQMRNAEDAKTRALFRESQNRILSMAMIHEKLYQSEGLHRIDLQDYIDDLAREVFTSFGDLAAGITLETEVHEIALGLDTAIPCGLIIIELLSNALKYAFPPPRSGGKICIGLNSEGQGCLELTVSDNGVGLPSEVKIQELKSLGLRLVADLACYQLDGEISVSREKGTRIHVSFKEKAKPSRREDYQ